MELLGVCEGYGHLLQVLGARFDAVLLVSVQVLLVEVLDALLEALAHYEVPSLQRHLSCVLLLYPLLQKVWSILSDLLIRDGQHFN